MRQHPHRKNKLTFNQLIFKLSAIVMCTSIASVAGAQDNSSQTIAAKTVIGGVETVSILPHELVFNAKIDTGARNSSMHATNIEFFSLGENDFVRFKTKDSKNRSSMMELPLHRKARIKRHGGTSIPRAVVMIGICLDSVYKVVQVTLTDRSRFKYPFLIGESYLQDNFLVDVSNRFTKTTNCNSLKGQ